MLKLTIEDFIQSAFMDPIIGEEKNIPLKYSGKGSGEMTFTLENVEGRFWLLKVKGSANPGDPKIILDSIRKAIPEDANIYLAIDVSEFNKFSIKERKYVFEEFWTFTSERRIEYTYLVNPNSFLKMIALLVGVVYKDILFSVIPSYEEALKRYHRAEKKLGKTSGPEAMTNGHSNPIQITSGTNKNLNGSHKKLEGKGSGDFEFSLEQISAELWILKIQGSASLGDPKLITDLLKDIFPPKSDTHLIIDFRGFKRFSIKDRQFVYEQFRKLITNNSIAYCYLLHTTAFIKMVAMLGSFAYKIDLFSVVSSYEDALDKYKSLKENSNLGIDQVEQAIESLKSNELVKIAERKQNFHPSDPKSIQTMLHIKPNILYLGYKGKIYGYQAKYAIQKISDLYKKIGKINVVVDLSRATNVDHESREIFSVNRDIQTDFVHKNYYLLTPFFSILYRIYSYVNPNFVKKVVLIKSARDTIYNLIRNQEVKDFSFPSELVSKKPERSDLEDLDRDTLIEYVSTLQHEMAEKQQSNKEKIDDVFNVISQITWSGKFKSLKLPELHESDDYAELFKIINFLQEDIGELVEELRKSNALLEKRVEDRTLEISRKESDLRSLIENFQNSIWLIDSDYKILEFNTFWAQGVKQQYGITLKRGQNVLEIFPEELSKTWKKRYDLCLSGKSKSYFEKYDLKGKGSLSFEIRTFPIFMNEVVTGVAVLAVDITEIQDSKDKLEENNKQLLKLNNELDSFIYRSSHDLRAPISSVKGLIQVAKMEEDPTQKDLYLDMMRNSMDKLDGFIHEIMDITKNEKLEVQSEEIRIKSLMERVLDELAHSEQVSKIRINLNIPDDLLIMSDQNRLKTLIKNVIANAIKYRDEAKMSRIDIKASARENHIIIDIEDNGVGIEEEYLPKVTSMFYRAHPEKSGSGLGLYIVSDILAKLGGSVNIESEHGLFTRVIIKIPRS